MLLYLRHDPVHDVTYVAYLAHDIAVVVVYSEVPKTSSSLHLF